MISAHHLFLLETPVEQSDKRRVVYLLLAALCAGVGLLLNFTYRRYIYAHHINDWHLADVIGNVVAVPAATFFFYALHKTVKYTKFAVLLIVFFTWCFYEVFLSNTFDWWDILATLVMCFVMYPILNAPV